MLENIKKFKTQIIIVSIVILAILTVFIVKQINKNNDNTGWKKLGYEETDEQQHDLKMYEFGMDYCDACTAVESVYNQIKEKYKNQINFEYIDVNLKPNLTDKYNINMVPSFVIVNKDGEVISRRTGILTFEEFESFISHAKEVFNGNSK